jgi:hypothetical protein
MFSKFLSIINALYNSSLVTPWILKFVTPLHPQIIFKFTWFPLIKTTDSIQIKGQEIQRIYLYRFLSAAAKLTEGT